MAFFKKLTGRKTVKLWDSVIQVRKLQQAKKRITIRMLHVRYQLTETVSGKLLKLQLWEEETPLSFRQFLNSLAQSPEFCHFYNRLLAESPFEAFFWEHPVLSPETLDRPYECMLIRSNTLFDILPESRSFAEHFQNAAPVVDFPNRRGDAHLIVPTPIAEENHYTHLARFIRHAPKEQQAALWQKVGETTLSILQKSSPRWLSTAGLGVYWLHIRLDTRPKYYRHQPYR